MRVLRTENWGRKFQYPGDADGPESHRPDPGRESRMVVGEFDVLIRCRISGDVKDVKQANT
jgi:hypothetical protein